MATASILLSEEELMCSICLDVFTDPITTPCGHNYCNTCITQHWDRNDVCKCPICNKTFYRRPEFSVNKVLSEMADQFRKSKQLKQTSGTNQDPSKPHEVSCDVCTENKLKALKSCLVCLTSYCEIHLELHQILTALKPHKLTDPVKNLEDYMCKKHDKPLELFCKTDHIHVCQFCTVSDHKTHQVVSLEEAYEEKKAELGKTEAEVQQMIQDRQVKIQEVKHSAELSRKDADREIADSVQVFTALISCIERSQAELIDVIEKKKKTTTEKQAEDLIKELQQEITELKKRSSELKQLSHSEDHLHLLQNFTSINTSPPTKDWTNVNVHQSSYVETVRTAVAQLEKTLSQEMEKLRKDPRWIRQYAVDVTLDPDTAHPRLILSKDGKQVRHQNVYIHHSNSPKSFNLRPCVLGKQSFSSGRFYYEVQVKGKPFWHLGVARESCNRKGNITLSPNSGYWAIRLYDGKTYWANVDPDILLPVREKIQKVGVFVDYEEGLVSFYDVETRVHLYSFTGCTFTEKLYPFFNVGVDNEGENSTPLIISPINLSD